MTALSPADRLERGLALSTAHAAEVLDLYTKDGEPNRRLVRDMIRRGDIAPCNPGSKSPIVSAAELRRFMAEGPRKPSSRWAS